MLERAQKSVAGIERGLAVLDKDERKILERMYIFPEAGAVQRIMDDYNLAETSSAYKRVNKALLRFTVAMYGATES